MNLSKFVRPIFTIIIGIMLGIFLYQKFAPQSRKTIDAGDTSFVSKARAATEVDSIAFSRQTAITRAVSVVSPAVVSVNVTKINKYIQRSPYDADPFFRQFFPELFSGRVIERPVKSLGSGFIISSDGYIVTNEHVVGNGTEIIVAMGDGEEYKAELVGKDHINDVALLKIDKENLPYIRFGNSDRVLIGEWAIALGNPFGLFTSNQPTVTVGVISAVNRDFSPFDGRVYEDMLQTDAAINSGNSGGPLCNAEGEVIGMNTFIFTGDENSKGSVGIGFAIPSNHIREVVEKLKKRGTGDRDIWIGLYGINLNNYLARLIGFPSTSGVLIKRIDKHSPAEKAGVELGDVIVAINGIRISSTQMASQVIQDSDVVVGDPLHLLLWRAGKQIEKTIVLEKYPH